MSKKETKNTEQPIEVIKPIVKAVKVIESNLKENETYLISFQGAEVEVSGNVANILIKRGKATLIK